LDEEINTKKSVSSFSLRLRRFSKKKVSGVEKKNLSSFFSYLRDQGRFLGDTAKRLPESPTGINLSHHIVGVDNTESDFVGFRGRESAE
jgi:hypothetical protein